MSGAQGTGHWALIVHGGAHEIPPEKQQASRDGVRAALQAGRAVLEAGGSALEATEAAIRVLEADPTFNAGYGADLNSDGQVELDASMMDGVTLDVGAVTAVRGVRHPISVARELLREREVLLAAQGARRFAAERGAELCAPDDLISPEQAQARNDTVGCVALDRQGHLAAGVSTGGLSGQRPGRVGDSPQIGCGFYADNRVGAVVLSGEGESLARMVSAARILTRVDESGPDAAVREVLEAMQTRVGGDGGGLVALPDGQLGWWHNTPHMSVAYQHAGMPAPQVYLKKAEEGELVQAER